MAEFLDLPDEMLNEILSHCPQSTLLQLRLVSKRMKETVDGSKKFKEILQKEIRLDRGTLGRFMRDAPDIPFQSFSVDMGKRTSPHLLKDPGLLQQFVERYSPSIRVLRVSDMYCGTVVGKIEFYESLENVQVLEIDWMEPLGKGNSNGFQVCPPRLPMSGPVGHSMKRLKVDTEEASGNYFMEWIRSCPSLEVLKVPREFYSTIHIGAEAFGGARIEISSLAAYPYVLRLGAEGNLEHLKVLDLKGVRMQLGLCSEGDRRFFHDLLTRRNEFRVKNVSAKMLEKVRRVCVPPLWPQRTLELFKRKVVSTLGMHQMLKEDDGGFGALEVVTFLVYFWRNVREPQEGWNYGGGRMGLPRLKKINGHVIRQYGRCGAEHQDFLDRLFLPDVPRETVEELVFRFGWRWLGGLRITPDYFDRGFPNVTRVILNLGGFNREELVETVEVMSRKVFLEELSLGSRRGIPEEAFFGENEERPVLLRMTNLRKLSLHVKDVMGEVEVNGDRTLHLFARMSLSHLSIKGRGWEGVTDEGILALTEGPFGETVVSVDLDGLEGRDEWRRVRSGALAVLEGVARRNKLK